MDAGLIDDLVVSMVPVLLGTVPAAGAQPVPRRSRAPSVASERTSTRSWNLAGYGRPIPAEMLGEYRATGALLRRSPCFAGRVAYSSVFTPMSGKCAVPRR